MTVKNEPGTSRTPHVLLQHASISIKPHLLLVFQWRMNLDRGDDSHSCLLLSPLSSEEMKTWGDMVADGKKREKGKAGDDVYHAGWSIPPCWRMEYHRDYPPSSLHEHNHTSTISECSPTAGAMLTQIVLTKYKSSTARSSKLSKGPGGSSHSSSGVSGWIVSVSEQWIFQITFLRDGLLLICWLNNVQLPNTTQSRYCEKAN